MQMEVRPLRDAADYDWALAEVSAYFEHQPEPGTPAAARFDVLSALLEHYEARRWAIEPLGPIEMLHAMMEQRGLTQADLAAVLGSRSRASEVLTGKRRLTVEQAYRLQEAWGVPVEVMLRPRRAA